MPVREKEGHDIGALGNAEVSALQLAETYLNLFDVVVRILFARRVEGPAEPLLPYPEAQDIVAIDALVPSHEFLRRIVAEERLKTIDAKPTLLGRWHQFGIIFGVDFSQRQEIKRF